MKINYKNILILFMIFIVGFGTGMVVTFQIVFRELEAHGVSLWL